jgi:hypothetical protein
MKSVERIIGYQVGGQQSVTLALTGSEQTLPAGCIGVFPNKGGCTISSLKRQLVGGAVESTNFATTLGMASIDYTSVEPTPKWVTGAFTHEKAPYNWAKVTGAAGGHIECIIE